MEEREANKFIPTRMAKFMDNNCYGGGRLIPPPPFLPPSLRPFKAISLHLRIPDHYSKCYLRIDACLLSKEIMSIAASSLA